MRELTDQEFDEYAKGRVSSLMGACDEAIARLECMKECSVCDGWTDFDGDACRVCGQKSGKNFG